MKRFIVEIRVNPTDDWKQYKRFDKEENAWKSFEMLKKHRDNVSKEGNYNRYRLFDNITKLYYY
jgi:hypothetical protein